MDARPRGEGKLQACAEGLESNLPIERSPDKRTPDKNREENEVMKEKNKPEKEEEAAGKGEEKLNRPRGRGKKMPAEW